jgi:hypothetical protein
VAIVAEQPTNPSIHDRWSPLSESSPIAVGFISPNISMNFSLGGAACSLGLEQ